MYCNAFYLSMLFSNNSPRNKGPEFDPTYWQNNSSLDDHLKCHPLSSGSVPSGRLKNPEDIDKWSSLAFFFSERKKSVTRAWVIFGQSDGQ